MSSPSQWFTCTQMDSLPLDYSGKENLCEAPKLNIGQLEQHQAGVGLCVCVYHMLCESV